MTDLSPPVVRDVLDQAWQSAQRLAIGVIKYPADKRDEVMQHLGGLLTEVAREAGCSRKMACEFGAAMEQVIRDCVAEIAISGGGTAALPRYSVVSLSGNSCLALSFLSRASPWIDKGVGRALDHAHARGREPSLMVVPREGTLELAGVIGQGWPVRQIVALTRDGEDRCVRFGTSTSAGQRRERND